MRVCLQLALNLEVRKHVAEKTCVVDAKASYEDVVKVVLNKMNLPRKGKKVRLYEPGGALVGPGTVWFNNMVLVVATNDVPYLGLDAARVTADPAGLKSVCTELPPRHWQQQRFAVGVAPEPGPPHNYGTASYVADPVDAADETDLCRLRSAVKACARHTALPVIHEFQPAPGVVVFDYDDGDDWCPEGMARAVIDAEAGRGTGLQPWHIDLVTECRGLWVHALTGQVLLWRLPKFFEWSASDSPGSAVSRLDVDDVCSVTEKLDGTLVSPVLLPGLDGLQWVTRKQVVTAAVLRSVPAAADAAFAGRVTKVLQQQWCLFFEWCTCVDPVGVLCYTDNRLVYLGRRATRHPCEFDPRPPAQAAAEDLGWPDATPSVDASDLPALLVALGDFTAAAHREGVVVRHRDGRLVKAKSKWYYSVAEASGMPQRVAAVERLLQHCRPCALWTIPVPWLWEVTLQGFPLSDAVNAACEAVLPAKPDQLQAAAWALARDLCAWAQHALAQGRATPPALRNVLTHDGWPSAVVTAILSAVCTAAIPSHGAVQAVGKYLCRLCRRWRVGHVDALLRHASVPPGGPSEAMQTARQLVARHVLEVYLPAKFAKLATDAGSTLWQVQYGYGPQEGKLPGLHEQFAVHGVVDLRLDVQPASRTAHAVTSHNGTHDYALLSVQCELPVDGLGTVDLAGVAVPVLTPVTVDVLREALATSFASGGAVCIVQRWQGVPAVAADSPPQDSATASRSVYVDLDDVLADYTGSAQGRPVHVLASTVPNFFEDLPWAPGGQEVWAAACRLCSSRLPTILTGVPEGVPKGVAVDVARQKRAWVLRHLGSAVAVVTCASRQKSSFCCRPGAVLVDDYEPNVVAWKQAGGVGIWHVRPARTLFELGRLQLSAPVTSAPGLDSAQTERWCAHLCPDTLQACTSVVQDLPEDVSTDGASPVVGIDAEWIAGSPVESGVSIVQVAVMQGGGLLHVYIVDVQQGRALPKHLAAMLGNPAVCKVGFGLQQEDLARLNCGLVANVVDLQVDTLPAGDGVHRVEGLLQCATRLCGAHVLDTATFTKARAITMGDWAQRPLPAAFVHYAALDAAMLLCMAEAAGPTPGTDLVSVHVPRRGSAASKSAAASSADVRPGDCVKGMFWAVALDASSVARLQALWPPRLPVRQGCGDHVTLGVWDNPGTSAFDPSWAAQRLGAPVCVQVTGYGCMADVQAVRVTLDPDPGQGVAASHASEYHITLSHSEAVGAVDAVRLRDEGAYVAHVWDEEPLRGRVCAVVATVPRPLQALPARVQSQLQGFLRQCQALTPGQAVPPPIVFPSAALTAAQRATVHEFCVRSGLQSSSDGVGTARTLTVRAVKACRPKQGKSSLNAVFASRQVRVFDRSLLDSLTFLVETDGSDAPAEDLPEDAVAGALPRVQQGGALPWSPPDHSVVVLRGLPGSGKSTVAATLAPREAIVSADDFAHTCSVHEAHGKCLQALRRCLGCGRGHAGYHSVIVVDNTHSVPAEYSAYVVAAAAAGRAVAVVELVAADGAVRHTLRARSVHDVKWDTHEAMARRWQADPKAVKFVAWTAPTGASTSVMRWLDRQGLLRMSPGGTPTHMAMGTATNPRPVFVHLPLDDPDLWDQFEEAYVQDTLACKVLAEVLPAEGQPFYFFMDIDGFRDDGESDVSAEACLTQVADNVRRLTKESTVVVTWTQAPPRVGAHVHSSYVIRGGAAEAVHLGRAAVLGTPCVLDEGVYVPGNGLRMLGSQKVATGTLAVVGREYSCLLPGGRVDKAALAATRLHVLPQP
jgi:predicted kinase